MATNRKQKDGLHLSVVVSDPAAPDSGDPVRFGSFTGVALTDEGDGGNDSTKTSVDFSPSVWDVSVDDNEGTGVAVGDAIYYHDTATGTPATNLNNTATGANAFFGTALETVGANATTTIEVLHAELGLITTTASEVGTGQLADGAVTRAKLAENALQPFPIPFTDVMGADGAVLAISETAGDFYRDLGTNQLRILGEISNGTVGADTEVSVGWMRFVLPDRYVDGGDITIRAGVDVIGSGALGTCTIDFSAYKQSGTEGTVGSDLVATAATAISATAGNKDFTVTPTGLVAGDILNIKMTTTVDNTDSTAIQAQISTLSVLCDVK